MTPDFLASNDLAQFSRWHPVRESLGPGDPHLFAGRSLCLVLLSPADIYDRVSEEIERRGGLDCECVGGGRIRHDSQAKRLHVYGYSMGFGRANHSVATEKLKARYPDYEVTWANEGY
nr:PREDICTED: 14 kDa phosphohistidine phosphatase [Lepisosteus oculatus]